MNRPRALLLSLFLLILGPLVPAAATSDLGSEGLEQLLRSHRGNVVLVDYWATWCPPCRTDMPALEKLHQRYHEDGLRIVGVSVDRDEKAVKDFIRDHKISYPIYMARDDLRKQERIMLLPTTVLVNRSGVVSERYQGSVPKDRLEAEIRSLLFR